MTQREKIEQLLENYAGRILTYEKRYLVEHHDPKRLNADRDHAVTVTATQIETLITEGKIEELRAMPNHTSVNLHVRERLKTLQASLKGNKE